MKRFISIILVIITVLTMMSGLTFSASAESLYIRKIISVVYDDSSSMNGRKWAYANYAMQAFCGMLNSEDQLYITYMSQAEKVGYDPQKVDLSSSGIQNSIRAIQNHTDMGATPFGAVEVAFNKLKSVKDNNPNTQYWLVVITDGEFQGMTGSNKAQNKKFLNQKFESYASQTMPNGSTPQITFLGISDVVSPDENQEKGIYTYFASDADSIVETMSRMADRISGRSRLRNSDIKMVNNRTIQVSSSVPLLNIVVFSQKTEAKISKATQKDGVTIPISRKATLNYLTYSDLVGGAYLLGDSKKVIPSGTYDITFEKDISLDNVIVLFEPALEIRMVISVNGKEISNYDDMNNVSAGDKVSVSCKIYEMGTNTEISPTLLPPDTKLEVSILEGGKVVKTSSNNSLALSEHELKKIDTEIKSTVKIAGFNPINNSVKFTPTEYVPKVVYTIGASFANNVSSVKHDEISNNKDLVLSFVVYADGVPMTDPAEVKALNPIIEVSPQGNGGTVTYSADGKILYTPNSATAVSEDVEHFDVDVTCTIKGGVSASETYTVLIADYKVISKDAAETVKKTELFDNKTGVSFYITKDGERLDKAAVEKGLSIALNEEHKNLAINLTISDDGIITVVPYSVGEKHTLTFWSWWGNWIYYAGLEGEDVEIVMNHKYGSATARIDIVRESMPYLWLNVYLPFLIELVLLVLLITWIFLIVTKPRFSKGAVLYVGDITYNSEYQTHILRNFSVVRLAKFNKIKKGNGRLKFKRKADIVKANGVKIRADRGNRIICEMQFPWYKGRVIPVDTDYSNLNNPKVLADYFTKSSKLEMQEIPLNESVNGDFDRTLISPYNLGMAKYIIIPSSDGGEGIVNDRKVIKSGILFLYANE